MNRAQVLTIADNNYLFIQVKPVSNQRTIFFISKGIVEVQSVKRGVLFTASSGMILQFLSLSVIYVLLVLLFYLVYNYRKNYTHWTESGLPYIPFPRGDSVFYLRHKADQLKRFYDELAPHPVAGIFKMSRPHLLLRDPALIQRILIKDFAHFENHGIQIDEKLDPLNLHIFNIEGTRWKNVRNKISPALSSGKMRGMWPYLEECKHVFEEYLDRRIETDGQIEVLEVVQKYAIDVIGTCAFGLKCNAIQDEDSEYRRIAALILRPGGLYFFRSLLRSTGLNIISWIKWKRIDAAVDDFIFTILRESIKHRAENENKRQDFVQHLINIQQEELETLKKEGSGQEPLLTEPMVAAQVFVFFVAGYETTSGTLAYCLHELAQRPEIVEKCRAEVKKVVKENGGTLNYECLKDLTYIESVIDETLRLYPIAGVLDRICNTPYEIPGSNYIVRKGQRILIPVLGLHHDPKYFPDPEKFDPDRFSEKNKSNIVRGTYLPFGDGPRMCIGMRFAFMEMKATLASLVMRYDLEPSEKTEIPLKIERTMLLYAPKNGVWLRLKKRAVVDV